ncbi:MAG: SLOG family protein [Eubacteriales bacterium]
MSAETAGRKSGREVSCCFTGHRVIPSSERDRLRARILESIMRLTADGVFCFCCGGALGFDTLAAQCVLEARRTDSRIRLLLFLPYPAQSERWSISDRHVYEEILRAADAVSYASEAYTEQCMLTRNRQLVDASCVCIAYLTHPHGGTFYTVTYARREGIPVINLAKE